MPLITKDFDFSHLSPAERLDLIDALWDSLAPGDAAPLTEEQRRELDNRLEALKAGALKTSSWEDTKRRLKLDE